MAGQRGNPNWKPGVSGNPGGRPRIVSGIRRKAQNDSEEAYAVLLKEMREAEKPSERISAAVKVLQLAGAPMSEDRTPEAEQRPAQPSGEMTAEQLEEIAAGGEA